MCILALNDSLVLGQMGRHGSLFNQCSSLDLNEIVMVATV